MKKRTLTLGICILMIGFVAAHGEGTFAEAEEMIMQKTPCSELSDEQLEILGDYYMEQMHPGEQHELMDKMMGGEGSESLRQMHINMGLAFYCGEHEELSGGMMGSDGIMSGLGNTGNYYAGGIFSRVMQILVIVVLVLLVIFLVMKLCGDTRRKR